MTKYVIFADNPTSTKTVIKTDAPAVAIDHLASAFSLGKEDTTRAMKDGFTVFYAHGMIRVYVEAK